MTKENDNMNIPNKYVSIVEYYKTLIKEGKITKDDVPKVIRQYL